MSNRFMSILSDELNNQLKKHNQAKRELQWAPEGRLKTRNRENGMHYYQYVDGVNIRLDDKSDVLQGLLKKQVNKYVVDSAEKNVVLLRKLMAQFQPNDYSDTIDNMSQSYKRAYDVIFKATPSATQNLYLFRPDAHKHETISGIYVRSKSEVIIANTLTSYGIPFSYEERFPVLTSDGKKIYPDFKIKCPDAFRIIWEHWGMLQNLDYCKNQMQKLHTYNNEGYVLGKNLIITADDNNGGCNAQLIDQIVRTMILPHMGI